MDFKTSIFDKITSKLSTITRKYYIFYFRFAVGLLRSVDLIKYGSDLNGLKTEFKMTVVDPFNAGESTIIIHLLYNWCDFDKKNP